MSGKVSFYSSLERSEKLGNARQVSMSHISQMSTESLSLLYKVSIFMFFVGGGVFIFFLNSRNIHQADLHNKENITSSENSRRKDAGCDRYWNNKILCSLSKRFRSTIL